jgi:hypothetical protein
VKNKICLLLVLVLLLPVIASAKITKEQKDSLYGHEIIDRAMAVISREQYYAHPLPEENSLFMVLKYRASFLGKEVLAKFVMSPNENYILASTSRKNKNFDEETKALGKVWGGNDERMGEIEEKDGDLVRKIILPENFGFREIVDKSFFLKTRWGVDVAVCYKDIPLKIVEDYPYYFDIVWVLLIY